MFYVYCDSLIIGLRNPLIAIRQKTLQYNNIIIRILDQKLVIYLLTLLVLVGIQSPAMELVISASTSLCKSGIEVGRLVSSDSVTAAHTLHTTDIKI